MDYDAMGENGVGNTMAGIVSKPLRKAIGKEAKEVEKGPDIPFAAFYMIQCRVAVSMFSTIGLEEKPTSDQIMGLKAKIPKSAEALKVTWGPQENFENEEGQSSRKTQFVYFIKKNRR